jgi:hypothetical protein
MLSRRALLWLVPFWISIHNLEEMVGMSKQLSTLPASLPGWMVERLPQGILPPSYRQFLVALLVVTVLPYLFALLGGSARSRSLRTTLLAETQALMLINAGTHLAAALLSRGYVPGLVTAVGFNLPFSLYFFGQGLKTGWVRDSDLGPLFLIAVLLHGPGLVGLFMLAARLTALLH